MRIITGIYKGRHFDVPRWFKARPTTDFAKENLFNVLRAYMDFEEVSALDLFGGTGSISLELLSRGCRRVVTVEKDRRHYSFIEQCCKKLGDEAWQPLCGDVLKFVERCGESFDLVFASLCLARATRDATARIRKPAVGGRRPVRVGTWQEPPLRQPSLFRGTPRLRQRQLQLLQEAFKLSTINSQL